MIARRDDGSAADVDRDPTGTELGELPGLVEQIVETMRRGNVAELQIERGDFKLSLRTQPAPASMPLSVSAAPASVDDGASAPDGDRPDLHLVMAPMVGTYYAAPAPGEPPFVEPGDVVEQGQTVAIVEAMKIMNEIACDRPGTVVEVLAENGQTVEYGSPLVRIRVAS